MRVGDTVYYFDPTEVETSRPDVYNPGYFSMFDVLRYIGEEGFVDLEYMFDESLNTNRIESIDGVTNWWYEAFYDGGSPERSIVRVDHYMWREGASLRFYRTTPSHLERIYSLYRLEVERREKNGGVLILPRVIIRGGSFTKEFENVEVIPWDMRGEAYREGTTTVLDLLRTLDDQGEIDVEVRWFNKYGTARIDDYWLVGIDGVRAKGRSGWAYEVGSFMYWRGLYRPHIPVGIRPLNSPDYVEFYWHL